MRGIGLAKLRTKSLRETAKDIGISAMYLSEIERGLKLPSKDMRKRIEEYYDRDLTGFWRQTEIEKLRTCITIKAVKLKALEELDRRAE